MANQPSEKQKPIRDWTVETGIRLWFCSECRKRYGLPVAQRVAQCPACLVYLKRSESE